MFSDPHCKVPTTYKILQPNEYWTICGNVYFKRWYCVDRATYMSKGHLNDSLFQVEHEKLLT